MPITADTKGLEERRVIVWIARAVGYLVYAYLIIVEIILLLGFLLLLFGANPTAGFVQWAYRNLDRVMEPFRGIFEPIELGSTSADVPAVLDTSIIFAMVIYGILALALGALTGWLTGRLRDIEDAEAERQRRAELEERAAEARAAVDAAHAMHAGYVQPTPPAQPADAPPPGAAGPPA